MNNEELMELFGNMPQQPEQTIGPIPESGISQQALLEMIMPFGGMGRIAGKSSNVIKNILSRNAKAVKDINAHNNIDKLISSNKFYDDLAKLNPNLQRTGKTTFQSPGVAVQEASSRGNLLLNLLKKLLPATLLGVESNEPEESF